MPLSSLLLLFAGGVLGGVINVMAGGAGFMTFPLLIAAGLSEMEANAANFVALLPANIVGTAVYSKELKEVSENLVLRLVIALVGGAAGSLIFIWAGEANFHRVIPYLLLFATLSFALGPTIKHWLETHAEFDASRYLWLSFVLEFLVFVYGGYFGLGMGIIILAIHSIFSHMSVHHANALRNVMIVAMTFVSITIFAHSGLIRWLPSIVMMAGAVCGGYFMSKVARRVPADKVRLGILGWSILLTAFSFWRYS
jgi:uncharacterized protein